MEISNRGHLLTEESNQNSYDLDNLSTLELVELFSKEDLMPQVAVSKVIPTIASAIDSISFRLKNKGRLFYIGAGTSGRLGVLDAAECPPTFCTPPEMVQGIIAGGYNSLLRSSEDLEDSQSLSISDLVKKGFSSKDCLVGITAGGTTPYVTSAIDHSKSIGSLTISIASVPKEQASFNSDIDIRIITGPEVLTGSTRLKAGTATKMVLNIISTCVMVRLGKVYKNRMIDLSASNSKLLDRSIRILSDLANLERTESIALLERSKGSVKLALLIAFTELDLDSAEHLLENNNFNLRESISSFKKI
ncbi:MULTISPECIES: N-acetylmuramic acid 6-phosphate etherase [Prochlorococcus]|uniref:N-acetylmuramic acid 6-phosphate etherase n=1 Tax=Prochlorococcus TaxID=1218 RepID=UPI0005339B79|nr:MULTISPECIES: N-acetylmuramic acid 6-phosphate etherase [Prochlorococcus]KGG12475.1 N-acetylmuramic acid 6-phosphate etherase [Prochlorococcus sp. MIT 0601]